MHKNFVFFNFSPKIFSCPDFLSYFDRGLSGTYLNNFNEWTWKVQPFKWEHTKVFLLIFLFDSANQWRSRSSTYQLKLSNFQWLLRPYQARNRRLTKINHKVPKRSKSAPWYSFLRIGQNWRTSKISLLELTLSPVLSWRIRSNQQ